MKKYSLNTKVKVASALVMAFTLCVAVVLTTTAAMLSEYGLFSKGEESFKKNITKETVYNLVEMEWQRDFHWEVDQSYFDWNDGSIDSTYFDGIDVQIKDSSGTVVYSDYDQNVKYTEKYSMPVWSSEGRDYTVDTYVKEDLPKGCALEVAQKYGASAYSGRMAIVLFAILNAIASITLFIYLIMVAGRREGDDELHLRRVDNGYADVYGIGVLACGTLCIAIADEVVRYNGPAAIIILVIGVFVTALITVATCMSISVQVKNRSFLRNSLTGRCCCFAWRILCKCWKVFMAVLSDITAAIPNIWKNVAIVMVVLMVNFMLAGVGAIGLIVVESIIILMFVLYRTTNIDILDKAVEKIANGEVGQKIKLDNMMGGLKRRGENLVQIDEAVAKAVEEQLKSERLQTELITNVSHDIKTPLASIINYTDLLKQHLEDGEDETAKEYIEVISKNSQRLKKLTSDVVEASKASTGAIEVARERLDLGMLAEQSVTEYESMLKSAGLTPVVNIDDGVEIEADGKLMWRIVDNILSNICKYALSGTRVYIEVKRIGDKAVAEFKNISQAELNVSTDELMERFVRGDASRNTEGSGLGLSIASNLAKLQGAVLDLSIDGDLFKTKLTIDCANIED